MCNQCGNCNPCSNCNSCNDQNTINNTDKFVVRLEPIDGTRNLLVTYNDNQELTFENFFPANISSGTDVFINDGEIDIDNETIILGYNNNGNPLSIDISSLINLINNNNNCCELEVREIEGNDYLYYNDVQIYQFSNINSTYNQITVFSGNDILRASRTNNVSSPTITKAAGVATINMSGSNLISATILLDSDLDKGGNNAYKINIDKPASVLINYCDVVIYGFDGTGYQKLPSTINKQTLSTGGLNIARLIIDIPNMFPSDPTKTMVKILF